MQGIPRGIRCAVYDKVVANPTITNIEEARTLYLESGTKAIIAFGGGSSNAGSILVDSIREAAQKTSAFRRYCPYTRFVSARFQNDAGILGAAALVS